MFFKPIAQTPEFGAFGSLGAGASEEEEAAGADVDEAAP